MLTQDQPGQRDDARIVPADPGLRPALDAAAESCRRKGLRLTPVRRRVLELLLGSGRAMGAYEVLDVLRAEGLGSTPPQAYRALDFLVGQGLAHRIEGASAFVACAHPRGAHTPVFLVCKTCSAVTEADLPGAEALLAALARDKGFAAEHCMIEASGLCAACREAARAPEESRP